MRKERNLQTAVLRYLTKIPESHWYNLHGSIWVGKGRPDIIGCVRGRFVAIELKINRTDLDAIQKYELELWERAGAIAFVATSVAEVKEKLVYVTEGHT